MKTRSEFAVTVSMYVQRTYIVTDHPSEAAAIQTAKDRLYYESGYSDVEWEVSVEDHSKIIPTTI